ncbi:MAG: DUF421 domain-containing protein [Mycobacteriales bacterium]
MSSLLGLTWLQAFAVVLSTIGIYLTLLVLLRLVGQRAVASMSGFDFSAAVAFGAVVGRVVVGLEPTLLAGVIGLVTLFSLQRLFGLLRRRPRLQATFNNPPILLLAHGRVLHDNLRRAHVIEDELREKLRLNGVGSYEEVACMVLERTGAVSVVRSGTRLSTEVLADIQGADIDALASPVGRGRME